MFEKLRNQFQAGITPETHSNIRESVDAQINPKTLEILADIAPVDRVGMYSARFTTKYTQFNPRMFYADDVVELVHSDLNSLAGLFAQATAPRSPEELGNLFKLAGVLSVLSLPLQPEQVRQPIIEAQTRFLGITHEPKKITTKALSIRIPMITNLQSQRSAFTLNSDNVIFNYFENNYHVLAEAMFGILCDNRIDQKTRLRMLMQLGRANFGIPGYNIRLEKMFGADTTYWREITPTCVDLSKLPKPEGTIGEEVVKRADQDAKIAAVRERLSRSDLLTAEELKGMGLDERARVVLAFDLLRKSREERKADNHDASLQLIYLASNIVARKA